MGRVFLIELLRICQTRGALCESFNNQDFFCQSVVNITKIRFFQKHHLEKLQQDLFAANFVFRDYFFIVFGR